MPLALTTACRIRQVSQIPWLDNLLDKNPIMRIGPPQTITGMAMAHTKLVEYAQKKAAAEEKPESDGSGNGRVETYVDKFLRLKETYPEIVDDDLVFQYTLFNMIAGGDTTASVLRASVYHLAKNPSCCERLQAELDGAGLSSLPARFKEVSGLTYLTAVVRETMRVNPGVSLTIERVAPKEGLTLPDGRFIPGDARVAMDPSVIMKNEPIFGPEDVMEFHPERWLRRDGESDDDFDARSRKMVSTLDFVFGYGKRMCTGRHLAWMEVFKLLATMYSVYDVSPSCCRLSHRPVVANPTCFPPVRSSSRTRITSGSTVLPGSSSRAIFPCSSPAASGPEGYSSRWPLWRRALPVGCSRRPCISLFGLLESVR